MVNDPHSTTKADELTRPTGFDPKERYTILSYDKESLNELLANHPVKAGKRTVTVKEIATTSIQI